LITAAQPTVRDRSLVPAGLTIQLSRGTGHGPTLLSAFDGALRATGVHNFNLLRLSSVVPPGSVIDVLDGPATPKGDWGDRLYVVRAEQRTATAGEGAWAGIGWVQEAGTRRGLFVEHEGTSEEQVRSDIDNSLAALCDGRPETFGPVQSVLHGTTCDGTPTCALVVAVFKAEGWDDPIDLS
jgi:arginine decarboxylase